MLRIALISCVLFTSCLTVPEKVTKEEALAAAKRLEEMVLNRSVEGYASFFDKEALVKLVISKSRSAKDENLKTFNAAPAMTRLAKTTIAATETGSFRLLRQYEKDGEQRLLFRIILNEGFTYQDFHLVKVKNAVKADDVYTYTTGQDLSTTLAEAMDALAPEGASLRDTKKLTDSILLMQKKKDRRDYVGAKEMFERLPVEIQNSRGQLLGYIEVCSNINETLYRAALEKFAGLYPDAPNSYMLMLDVYAMAGEYEKVLFAVNRIDTLAGGDGFLEYFRGNVYRTMGKMAESKASYEKAYAKEPELEQIMESLVVVYMEDKETDKAKKVITSYKASKIFSQEKLDLFYENYPELNK